MIRVLLVLGLVACGRETREENRDVVVAPRAIARPSPARALPSTARAEGHRHVVADTTHDDDANAIDRGPCDPDDGPVDDGPLDDDCIARDGTDHAGIDVDASHHEAIAVGDDRTTDHKAMVVGDDRTSDHRAVAVAVKAIDTRVVGGDDHSTDRDFDDIPDELDKCPDIPENTDGFEDIDGCPEPMTPST